jgi:hypothetical protein
MAVHPEEAPVNEMPELQLRGQPAAGIDGRGLAAAIRGSGRDLAIALSLANLCFLRVWSELLTYQRADTYLMRTPPGPAALMAATTAVLLMAGTLWALVVLARALLPKPWFRVAQVAFLLFLALPLNAVRSVLSQHFTYLKSPLFELLGTRGVSIVGISLAAVGLGGALLFHRKLAPIAATVVAAFLPLCAITFGQAVWKSAHYDATRFANKPLDALLPNAPGFPRFVWILCDEWDYRLTFVDPNPTLALPEIAGLRNEVLFADHALPPGPETPVSIPGYFTGRLVQSVAYDGPRELQVTFRGASAAVPWSAQPGIFAGARAIGFNTALVDWFHPSCRILSGLTYCEWWEMAMQHNSMGQTFWRMVPGETRSLAETTLFSVFGQSLSALQQIDTYQAILKSGLEVVNNPTYGFSFVHLPIPHAPHAYDRRTGRFTLKNAPISGYVDSLALLDRTLGEIRRSMMAAGTWDRTTVLFSSDHGYREAEVLDGKSDPRIPFLLKLPSQKGGIVYSRPFNAILTKDLVLAVLKGEVPDAASAVRWLDRNRSEVRAN